MSWTAIVPVKPTVRAKTRLGLSADQRAVLARAFTLDVLSALAATDGVGEVIVVGPFPGPAPDVRVIADPGKGLNTALLEAAGSARSVALLAVMGDLPCLTPDDVTAFLADVDPLGGPLFVADTAGIGTTLLAWRRGTFQPRFGRRSRASHLAAGAREHGLAERPGVHRDVDSVVDLWDAYRLGLGTHSARAVMSLGLLPDVPV